MLAAFQIDADEEAPGKADQRKRAFLELGVVIAVTLTVGFVLGRLTGGSGPAPSDPDTTITTTRSHAAIIDGPAGRDFEFSSARDRGELVDLIKESSNQEPDAAARHPMSSVDTLINKFKINPDDHMRYANGARRRPTDPATPEEIEAALLLLFGDKDTVTLAEADALAQNPKGWAAINAKLEPHQRLYPEYFLKIQGAESAACPVQKPFGNWGPYNDPTMNQGQMGPCPQREDAQSLFFQHVESDGMVKAHEWLRTQNSIRQAVKWSGVSATSTFVKKSVAVDFEDALDRGEEPDRAAFRKYLMVKATGGPTEEKPNGDVFDGEQYIVVDVTDPQNPATEAELLDVYSRFNNNKYSPRRASLVDVDLGYLIAATHALYGGDQYGKDRVLFPACNSDPRNFHNPTGGDNPGCSMGGWGAGLDIRYFVKPFAHADGHENASAYGATERERVLMVHVNELPPALIPMDGNQVTAGVFLSPTPLVMFRTVAHTPEDSTVATPGPRKDPRNTLRGSEVIAMTWYGRGLEFTEAQADVMQAALGGSATRQQNEDVRVAVTAAINRAWGNEELYGTRPGALVNGRLEIVEKHPRSTPEYLNHATATVVKEVFETEPLLSRRNNSAPHRDVRDNPPWARPLIDSGTGLPKLQPTGKRLETIAVGGPSFTIDGYGVEWDVGLKWRFNIGFELDAGLTLFNLRVVLPPSEESPSGQVVPYMYKINIPNFGTSYATSNLGNLFSADFLESHFGAALGAVPGSNCRGPHASFPIFRAKSMKQMVIAGTNLKEKPVFYSTYGVPGYVDPFASGVLGHLDPGFKNLPFQALALDGSSVNQGIIPDMFCISESDSDHALWHLYTAQRQRKLTILQPTISDAYNILLTYEFFSNGKMTIAERLHGKPAVVNFGLGEVGGAYSSRGKGGMATNHIHWVGVHMEPHLKKNIPGVRNALLVEDLAWDTDETNWFGMSFNRVPREVKWSNQSEDLRMNYPKNRFWTLAAIDENGKNLGGLSMKSPAWGPHPVDWDKPPLRWKEDTEFEAKHTFQNHWWLYNQDLFLTNAADTRNKQVLLSRSRDSSCSQPGAERCLPAEEIIDSPAIEAIMKLYHAVITDELPVQDGFTQVQIDLWPHNLFDFNPGILSRYMPGYAERFQNNWFHEGEKIYTPPYTSEWAEL